MRKTVIFLALCTLLMGSALQASCIGSAANRYYGGEISTDEYIDSLGVPRVQNQETYVYYGNGKKALIRSNNAGGTIYHEDGTKSGYTTYSY